MVAAGCGGVNGVVVLAHFMALSLALVEGQVEVTKHLLSATLAPMSVKYCLERFIP